VSVRREPPNVTKQRMPPLTDDTVYTSVRPVCAETSALVSGDEVRPADPQYTPLAAQIEGFEVYAGQLSRLSRSRTRTAATPEYSSCKCAT